MNVDAATSAEEAPVDDARNTTTSDAGDLSRALFAAHGHFVLRCARRFGVADADLEDVLQNVFIIVMRKQDTFDGNSARSWLFGITRRVAADHRKRAHRRHEIAMLTPPEVSHAGDTHEAIERREVRVAMEAALACLDEVKRDVFVLHELEELSMQDVAAAVGCPLKTAYARLYAARAHVIAHVKAKRRAP